jgi:tripartite-type tricarboxylate transporter receptor subunit TctC
VKRFEELGITAVKMSVAEFRDLVSKQANDWSPLIKTMDLK